MRINGQTLLIGFVFVLIYLIFRGIMWLIG